jgi:Uncharacterized conserved protein
MSGRLTSFIYPALFTALTIVLGFVSIPVPISPVPISGITLGVMLTGSVLQAKEAFYSVLTLILLGAVGLPVFSGFVGGIGILLGPRGGYYFGFLLGAVVIALLRPKDSKFSTMLLANIVGGILVVYTIAVPWLGFVTEMNLYQALLTGAAPFIIGDIIKAVIASILALALNKHLKVMRRDS